MDGPKEIARQRILFPCCNLTNASMPLPECATKCPAFSRQPHRRPQNSRQTLLSWHLKNELHRPTLQNKSSKIIPAGAAANLSPMSHAPLRYFFTASKLEIQNKTKQIKPPKRGALTRLEAVHSPGPSPSEARTFRVTQATIQYTLS